jgi:hypothetical protein
MVILLPIADLAVTDPGPGGGELNISSFQDFDVTHAVLAASQVGGVCSLRPEKGGSLFELSSNDVREDLQFPMGMKSKAIVSLDTVFVDDSQPSERFETIRKIFPVTPNSVNSQLLYRTYGGTANVYSASSQSVGRPPPRFEFSRSSSLVMLKRKCCWIVDKIKLIFISVIAGLVSARCLIT